MRVYTNIDGVGQRIVNFKPFANFSAKDLQTLRKEISLNSMYISDYNNSKGIDPEYLSNFFDAYLNYICDLASVDGITEETAGNAYLNTVCDVYDTNVNLTAFHCCEWDFTGVKYSRDIWINKFEKWVTVEYIAA